MTKEISVGALIFRKEKGINYLLLYKEANENYNSLWVFPRGNIEEKESEMETAKREIFEETGIKDLKFVDGFKEKIFWFYKKDGKIIYKEAMFFLAETKIKEVKLSEEHNDYKWCKLKEAMKLLKFKNVKEILEKADKFLKENRKNKSEI